MIFRSVDQFACQQPVGRSVSCLPVGVSVCLSVCRCLLLFVYLCVCVSICVCLSISLSVGGLSGGRSVYTVCLPFSRAVSMFVVNLSRYVPVCVPLSVYICLSICLCLSVCLLSVDRSVVSLSELSVIHSVHEACRQRRGGC